MAVRVAKINDVIFDCLGIEYSGGFKVSIEELLNGGRFFQHTGTIEPIITIVGRVYGPDRLARLENTLSKQNKSVKVICPTTNRASMDLYPTDFQYKLYDRSQVEIHEFTVKFYQSQLASDLAKASNSSNIKKSKFAFLTKTSDFIKNTYRVANERIQIATDAVNAIASDLASIASAIPSLVNELQLFTQSLQNQQQSLQTFIALPAILDSQIKTLVDTFGEIGQTTNDQIDALKNMLNGNLIQNYDSSCSFAENISIAQNPIQTNFYCYGVDRLIVKINDKEYTTKEAVQESIDYLNSQKEYITNKFYDKDLASELILYINATILDLKQKQIQLPPLFSYDFENISDVSAYYAYYGNLDGLEAWREYNKIDTYGIVNQNVKFY